KIFLQKGLDSKSVICPRPVFADPDLDVTAINKLSAAEINRACDLFRPRRHADRSQAGHHLLDPVRAPPARLRTTPVEPSGPLMIGDRSHHMVSAKNSGIKGLGVLYGYGSRD